MRTILTVAALSIFILVPHISHAQGKDAGAYGRNDGAKEKGAFQRAGESFDKSVSKTKEFFSDSAITTRVKKRLADDDYVSTFDFSIKTNAGVVTVSGEADSEKIAQRALDISSATKGVNSVVNKIVLIKRTPSKAR